MKPMNPEPFYFEGGKRAILLLHGFTSTNVDVRMIGRYLQDRGYSSYAPIYRGHGSTMEELVETNNQMWWEDVLLGYQFLKEKGHEEIAVGGLSLGGVFSLKLGYQAPIKGIITMCTPITMEREDNLLDAAMTVAKYTKRKTNKDKEVVQQELDALYPKLKEGLQAFPILRKEVQDHLDLIYAPILVIQGKKDNMIDINSAQIIYNHVSSINKKLVWYEDAGHVVTHSEVRNELHEEIYQFLESLDWQE